MKTSSRYLSSLVSDASMHIFSARSCKHEMMPVFVWGLSGGGGWKLSEDTDPCGYSSCRHLFSVSYHPLWLSHSARRVYLPLSSSSNVIYFECSRNISRLSAPYVQTRNVLSSYCTQKEGLSLLWLMARGLKCSMNKLAIKGDRGIPQLHL